MLQIIIKQVQLSPSLLLIISAEHYQKFKAESAENKTNLADIVDFDPLVLENWYSLDYNKYMVCTNRNQPRINLILHVASKTAGTGVLSG